MGATLLISGSVFAQQQQNGHPLNPPGLPRDSSSVKPIAPGSQPYSNRQSVTVNSTNWTAIGPAPLGSGNGANSGRLTGIAVSPTDPNTIYVAAAGGGVWKTTDGGTTWAALTDAQTTLAMGSIAIAPTDPNRIYAGTGEANNSLDSNHGNGILVSTDGGSTWNLQTANGAFAGVSIGQIAVDPGNENTAYAAVGGYGENGAAFVNTGIWKTTDGGNTWTNVTAAAALNSTNAWSAVVIDPNNTSIIYAAMGDIFNGGAVYRSTDGGSTWGQLTNAPSGANVGRIALAVSPAANTANHHVLYIAVAQVGVGSLLYFERSDNADSATPTFTNLTATTPDFVGSAGWYDMVINVDSQGVLYAAGVSYGTNILRSTNLGVTWSDITVINNNSPHTDHHAIVFDSGNRMLLGNDGGIWRYDSTVPSWTDLNGNLNTIQFQAIGLHPTSTTTVVGGAQDNGTQLYTNNTVWASTDGGDSGISQFSQTNPSTCYSIHPVASFGVSNFFQVSSAGCTGSWTAGTTGFLNANANFYPPYVVDRTNGNHLIVGLDQVYESTNAAGNWTSISTPGSNGFNTTANVDTVALSPANGPNPEVIYASTAGNPSGGSLVFVSTNDGGTWTQRNLPTCTATAPFSAGCRINQIVVDPNDATGNTAVAVTSNFTGGGQHVYRTTNAGVSWTDISLNDGLPDLPTWSAQIDTDPSRTIYVSNDTAVYKSVSPYSAWTLFGGGLAHAQGLDLELNNLHILALGTHGRGAWEILTPAHVTGVTTTDANGTYNTGAAIPIVVTFSNAVNVTGTPQLTLNTTPNGTASYTSGSGTASLTFTYTVSGGQTTTGNATGGHLDYTSGAALTLNGGTIAETSGNAAVLTLYAPGAAGSLSANSSLTITGTGGTLITPTVTVSPASSTITTSQSDLVTVTVSGGNGNPTPTGSVTLTSGTYNSGAKTLTAGSTSITIPAGSLAVGNDTLTAAYTPDGGSSATYNGAIGTAPVTVNQGIGACANPNPNPNPNPASFANPGDFNNDCRSDILWRNSNTQLVYTWLMNGATLTGQGSLSSPASAWVIQGTGDFNGDGTSDVLWRNSSTGEVYLWLMNGNSITSQASLGVVPSAWVIQGVGDFNGDGKADILWRNSSSNLVYLWTMNGASIASQGGIFAPTPDWVIQGVGDFNGDGKADILFRNSTSGMAYIWLMNGTAIVSQASPATVTTDWVIQGVGDFDGDGKSDIVWRNSTSGLVYLWLMNGTSIATQGSVYAPTADWVIQGVGDYNGDGKSDLLFRNSTSGQVYLWLMNGTVVTSQGAASTATTDWQIAKTLYP
jgi:photosystem II stability/assembly factor-like uncharacterized protein